MPFPEAYEQPTTHQDDEVIGAEATNELAQLANRVAQYVCPAARGDGYIEGAGGFRLAAWGTTETVVVTGSPAAYYATIEMPASAKSVFGKAPESVGFSWEMLILTSARAKSAGNPQVRTFYAITGSGLEVCIRPISVNPSAALVNGTYIISVLVLGPAAAELQASDG